MTDPTALHKNLGELLPLWSIAPFIGMLLSLALFPLFAPHFWRHHFGKVSAFWSAAVVIPLLIIYKGNALQEFIQILFADFVPFIILLGSLYAVSGGIMIRGTLRGTPLLNTAMLAAGTVLASWMGTTGASMLMIRPFLRANAHRENRTFMVVFFIFLVANVGGALTPLGDPPLFLGFLRGVPFFWTLNIFPHMAVTAALLLGLYFLMDSYFYKKEGAGGVPDGDGKEKIGIDGAYNFLFLCGIIGAILVSGIAKWGEISVLGVHRGLQDLARDGMLVLLGLLSLLVTPRQIHEDNEFTWFPMKEVAILFAGIFLTMAPCLKILQAGARGELAFIPGAITEPSHYFWITGVLSSFLDNAPTYLTFLNTLIGNFYPGIPEGRSIALVIKEKPLYLEAISAGAVFFGAVTYIGNAPNFLVRSIAEEAGVRMPGFFGYMLKYSLIVLVPVFIVLTLTFF